MFNRNLPPGARKEGSKLLHKLLFAANRWQDADRWQMLVRGQVEERVEGVGRGDAGEYAEEDPACRPSQPPSEVAAGEPPCEPDPHVLGCGHKPTPASQELVPPASTS